MSFADDVADDVMNVFLASGDTLSELVTVTLLNGMSKQIRATIQAMDGDLYPHQIESGQVIESYAICFIAADDTNGIATPASGIRVTRSDGTIWRVTSAILTPGFIHELTIVRYRQITAEAPNQYRRGPRQ